MESLQDQLKHMNKNRDLNAQTSNANSVSIDNYINDTSFDNKSLSSIEKSNCTRASLSSNMSTDNNHFQSSKAHENSLLSDSVNTTYDNISLYAQNESLLTKPTSNGSNVTYSEWDIIPSDDSINVSKSDHNTEDISNHLMKSEVINCNLITHSLDKNGNNTCGDKVVLSSPSTLEADTGTRSDSLSSTLENEVGQRSLNGSLVYKEIPRQVLQLPTFDAMVTSVTSPSLFCFIECDMWDNVEQMHKEMMDFYGDSPVPDSLPLKSGDICAAYHDLHEIWYRAVILTYPFDDGQAIVKFLDFSSDVEQVSGKHLRLLDESFCKLPFLSHKAALVGIKPTAGMKSWNDHVCKRLQELAVNDSFTVTVIGDTNNKVMVSMIGELPNKRKYSLSERLIQEGLADPINNS